MFDDDDFEADFRPKSSETTKPNNNNTDNSKSTVSSFFTKRENPFKIKTNDSPVPLPPQSSKYPPKKSPE